MERFNAERKREKERQMLEAKVAEKKRIQAERMAKKMRLPNKEKKDLPKTKEEMKNKASEDWFQTLLNEDQERLFQPIVEEDQVEVDEIEDDAAETQASAGKDSMLK